MVQSFLNSWQSSISLRNRVTLRNQNIITVFPRHPPLVHSLSPQFCKFWGSHTRVAKNSGLLGCEAVSLGEWSVTFRKITPPTVIVRHVRSHSRNDTASCLGSPKISPQSCLYLHNCYFWSILIICYQQCSGLRRGIFSQGPWTKLSYANFMFPSIHAKRPTQHFFFI